MESSGRPERQRREGLFWLENTQFARFVSSAPKFRHSKNLPKPAIYGKKSFTALPERASQDEPCPNPSRPAPPEAGGGARRSLRRGFGCRYAVKVPAQVLQKLMRHVRARLANHGQPRQGVRQLEGFRSSS